MSVSPEQRQAILDLLPTAKSLRDICRETGLRLDAVRAEAAPFLALMRMVGTHPVCECGRLRFHPYGCIALHSGRPPKKGLTDRQQIVVEAIMTGLTFAQIEAMLGMSKKSARRYLEFLTPEQLAQRKALEKERGYARSARGAAREEKVADLMSGAHYPDIAAKWGIALNSVYNWRDRHLSPEQRAARMALDQQRRAAAKAKRHSARKRDARRSNEQAEPVRPFRDPRYARIAAAVPRWLTGSLRDDVISEMYVAVEAGVLAERDIEGSAPRFARAAANEFENRWGPRSLNERRFDDGSATLIETIADPAATAAFDRFDNILVGDQL